MKRKVIVTADGSKTIYIEDWNEHYHSKHGASQEAQHVFIKNGLLYVIENQKPQRISILEMGFGTGLNAFLTLLETQKYSLKINYSGIEAYPVTNEELQQLNYTDDFSDKETSLFKALHSGAWEKAQDITSNFKLTKRQQFFQDISDKNSFDLIYFDAFGARVQPELWSKAIFKKMYNALKQNGVLVTYAAIGQVRRDMIDLGFEVERLQGPPGKRHMLRAVKL